MNKQQYYVNSQNPLEFSLTQADKPLRSVNWNVLDDPKDLEIWTRAVQNFWIPEKIPVSQDLQTWEQLDPELQDLVTKTFTGLTLLDTIQATLGDVAQIKFAQTDHEQAIYANFAFMVGVHARSYGTIFSTLNSKEEIENAHLWVTKNEKLQRRAKELIPYYTSKDPLKSKVAAALMPGFLLYGGFYLPFWLSSRGYLPNTADIIRLILRDKVLHNYYSGYKYQRKVEKLSPELQEEYKEFVLSLLDKLVLLEEDFLQDLYKNTGLAQDAIRFSKYNANKFLQNLGYDAIYPKQDCKISPEVFAQLSARADENHDFFSGNGSSYIMAQVTETEDEDWEF